MCKSTINECSMCYGMHAPKRHKKNEKKKSNNIAKRILDGLHINMYKIVCGQASQSKRQVGSHINQRK